MYISGEKLHPDNISAACSTDTPFEGLLLVLLDNNVVI